MAMLPLSIQTTFIVCSVCHLLHAFDDKNKSDRDERVLPATTMRADKFTRPAHRQQRRFAFGFSCVLIHKPTAATLAARYA